jgi:hypothetical protein
MARFLALVLAAAPLFQAEEEFKKPQQVQSKAQQNWNKKKGCHLKMEVTSVLLSAEPKVEKAEFEGKLLREFMAVRGSAELYGRGVEKLVRQDSAFVEPRRASARLNRISSLSRNPGLVAAELFRFQGGATFGADEKSGGEECRVIETAADEKTVMDQIKEVTGNLKSLEQYYIKDFTSITDRKKSSSTYKAWISKATTLPARIEWKLSIAINKKSIPIGGEQLPDTFDIDYVYEFTKYDTELQIDIPAPVKAKFGQP